METPDQWPNSQRPQSLLDNRGEAMVSMYWALSVRNQAKDVPRAVSLHPHYNPIDLASPSSYFVSQVGKLGFKGLNILSRVT